jgi:hypothetical protein
MSNTETVHTNEIPGMQGRRRSAVRSEPGKSHGLRRVVCAVLVAASSGTGCVTDADPDTIVARVEPGVPTQLEDPSVRGPVHCVAPWGIDWNDVLDVENAAIVVQFCPKIRASDPYIPEVLWFTNTEDGIEGEPVLYPPGYTPRDKAPTRDFVHKLVGVRYVVQPGNQEHTFRASTIEKGMVLRDLFEGSGEFTPPQMALPATSLLGELPPLPPGIYSADIHFIMSDTHCDGLTADFAKSCLPPGDSFILPTHFVVVP